MSYEAWRMQAAPILARYRSSDDHCGLLIVDVDDFKRVNDTYGHLAGDSVIEAVAGVIRDETRHHDLSGRFGGDEFLVLLDHLGDRRAVAPVADRIRRGVHALAVAVDTPRGPQIITGLSVSVGCATHHSDDGYPDLTTFMWAADNALYRAKRAGGNTFRIDQPALQG